MDIVFGNTIAPRINERDKLSCDCITLMDLALLQNHLEAEFYAGMQKDIENTDEAPLRLNPKLYDAFTIEGSYINGNEGSYRNGNISVVVSMPDKNSD